jgi:hypothetical protein
MSIYQIAINAVYLIPITLIFSIAYSIKVSQRSIYRNILVGYLIICLLFDVFGQFLGKLFENNLILIPTFGVLELVCFSLFYYQLIQHKICYIITIPTIVCFLYELINVEYFDTHKFQVYTRFLSTITILILAILYFFILIKMNWKHYNFNFFLLNSCLLIYSSFSCLYYLPINLLINWSSQTKFWFWGLNMLLTLMFYIVITKVICNLGKMKQ